MDGKSPVGPALDSKGNVWVDDNDNRVDHWIEPTGIAVNPINGKLVVPDEGNNRGSRSSTKKANGWPSALGDERQSSVEVFYVGWEASEGIESEMKIEYRNRRPSSDRSFTVETELDRWLGRILCLVVATVVLIVLWSLGIDPSGLLVP